MRRIEIITPQNVPIQFQLATVNQRILAFLLDILVMGSLVLIIYMTLNFFPLTEKNKKTVLLAGIIPVIILYSLVSELFMNGQSAGKKITGLSIIKLTGEDLQISDYLLRWAFRWVDIWGSLGSVAAFQISSSAKGQRIGDMLADTTVIKIKTDNHISLKELLSIKSASGHIVTYPEIRKMRESEMLLVKHVIERQRLYANPAHDQIVEELALNFAARLQLEKLPSRPKEFLQKLLLDYITITRSH